MKRRNLILAALLTALLLSGCGGAGANSTASISADYDAGAKAEEYGYYAMEDAAESEAVREDSGTPWAEGTKIIYTGSMDMETTDFDQAIRGLEDLTADCGGYVESSSVSTRGSGYRYADYTVRIPAERYGDFWDQAGALCHVTWKDQQKQNVSSAYYDTEGRLKTQQTKLERLQSLLARAETMEDIITIESAISETEYTIDSLSGELRYYDDLVSYSTITLSVSEVYRLSGTEEPADSFGARLGGAFVSGWQGFLGGLEDLAVALAYGWMWVLLVIAAAVLAVCWLRHRRAKRRRQALQEEQKP